MWQTKQRGVTLVELMVTIAILAILLGIAAPSFGDYIERSRLRAAADDVVSLIQRARSEAISTGLPVGVSPSGTATAWCFGAKAADAVALGTQLPTAPSACDCQTAGACLVNAIELRVQGSDYRGITIDSVEAGDGFAVDARLGTLTDPDVSPSILFNSANSRYQLRVQVSPMGHARSCVPSGKRFISGIQSC